MQRGCVLTSKLLRLVLLSAAASISTGAALAHEAQEHCAAVIASVEEAGFSENVEVTCENGVAVISSNVYPDHEVMTGIVGTNEQVPIPAPYYDAPIPLEPVLGATPQTRDGALGVAVNGVPIFDYIGGGKMTQEALYHHQTQHGTLQTQQLDACGGHAGRGDDYHYHVKPVCMIAQMENAAHDPIIGWAFDGFPIYGDGNPDGGEIADGALDVCNGQRHETFGHRYHTSEGAPYIVQCLMGEVADVRALPRVTPLVDAASSRPIAPGRPPRGGVENLVLTKRADGTHNMDYRYRGDGYYIRYRPSDRAGCYVFETRTVTNGGQVTMGEYCR
ncbi:YHYH protein [Roseobacter sinensis]|uniref:YHYH protein n=1 Tax=Roseobacter sinensis TaxID=2931391 RepID=A0ABT3BHM3_9RHOB|nr:YHYH protein [Roseobacter sp. WL0113]MCV3273078.1 YHYH protein [Roseobacter sp. WL0113]